MNKLRIFFCLLLASLTFLSCGESVEADAPVITEDTPVTLMTASTEEAEPITVSPLATECFLEPLDGFSWEREYAPEYVMIHFTSAVVLDRENPYGMDKVRQIFVDGGVSIHYIIDRDGEIYCYIPESRAAWHAGKGTFGEDERLTNAMNKYSIGIELVAIGSADDMSQYLSREEYAALDPSLVGFTDSQYESLSLLVKDICERNGISRDREHIIGHGEYNPNKSDPGELFDMERILK